MNLSIISQDGVAYNYSHAVASVATGSNEDNTVFGFLIFLNGDTENYVVAAEYDDEERFEEVRRDFFKWLSDNIEPTFVFPL